MDKMNSLYFKILSKIKDLNIPSARSAEIYKDDKQIIFTWLDKPIQPNYVIELNISKDECFVYYTEYNKEVTLSSFGVGVKEIKFAFAALTFNLKDIINE
jgi:hypothetical protein